VLLFRQLRLHLLIIDGAREGRLTSVVPVLQRKSSLCSSFYEPSYEGVLEVRTWHFECRSCEFGGIQLAHWIL